jgi:hypothetical protein
MMAIIVIIIIITINIIIIIIKLNFSHLRMFFLNKVHCNQLTALRSI